MEAQNFFWHVLLKDGDAERLFRVLEDELSFLHDYYYLSLPISYSKSWIPISNIVTSVLTIIYCLLLGLGLYFFVIAVIEITGQISCFVWCNNFVEAKAYYDYFNYTQMDRIEIGNVCCDLVPVFVLVALVVLSEMKDSASYIFGNWTKVALICCHVLKKCNETRQQQSMCSKIQGWVISRVLKCRFKFMKHWDDKMNQSSLLSLPHHQRHQKKRVKVPGVVKVAIVEALKRRSRDGAQVVDYLDILRRGMPGGDRKFLWACSGEGTVDIILVWHIATAIVEVRHSQQPVSSDNKIVATRLSQYCAYLVAYVPGLLPDDDPWCRQVYEAVKKDSTRVLAGRHQVTKEYDQLVAVLTDRSEHEVLKKGVRLGKQLAEGEQQEMVWRLLAGFWSAMVLGVAPSGRLSEHAEAVARGGELVTLLWALQMHAGTGPPDASSAESAV